MNATYTNVGTSPLLLPGGEVLNPGDTFTGTLPEAWAAWLVNIGAVTIAPAVAPLDAHDLDEEEG